MNHQIKQTRMEEHDIQEIKPEPSGYGASLQDQGEVVEFETGQELDYADIGELGYEDQGNVTDGFVDQRGKSVCKVFG